MIPMSVADKDDLDIPQNFSDVVRLVGIRTKESAHLTPRPFTGFKQNAPMFWDTDKVSRN